MNTSRFLHLLAALAVVLALFPSANVAAAQTVDNPPPQGDYIPGEVVILLDPTLPLDAVTLQVNALAGDLGAAVMRQNGRMALLSFAPDADVSEITAHLSQQPGVAYAGPNSVLTAAFSLETDENAPQPDSFDLPTVTVGKDGRQTEGFTTLSRETLLSLRTTKVVRGRTAVVPQYFPEITKEWGYIRIGGLITAPDKTPSPTVCILSSGVDAKHPDLKGRVVKGYDFVNMDGEPEDDNGLGTHLAGIIAANGGNGSNTALGISNGKVLAVKVLSASGLGSGYDIAAGINYCANRADVKIILLSMNGGRLAYNSVEYSALNDAISNKNKLVIVPAGNRGTSVKSYPAAWAVDEPFSFGLVSVAGSVSGTTWVDRNGDGVHQPYEDSSDCAMPGTNYGSWVKMVAPGDSIFSTKPTYKTFYAYYHGSSGINYGYFSGTAQAAAHVAAAAARLWGITPGGTNGSVAAALQDRSLNLHLDVDPTASDPDNAFSGSYRGASPFCWPWVSSPFTAVHSMSASRFVNLAAVMQRGAVKTAVWDAMNGMPLIGAMVRAIRADGKTSSPAVVGDSPDGEPYLIVPNLPTGASVKLQVQAKGRTAGYQTYSYSNIAIGSGVISDPYGDYISLSAGKEFQVVADWHYADSNTTANHYDMDLFIWLPGGAVNPITQFLGGVVGSNPSAIDWNSDAINIPGNMFNYPYARAWRDGGGTYNPDKTEIDRTMSEAISIAHKPGTSRPYFDGVGKGADWRPDTAAYYHVLIHAQDPEQINGEGLVVRVWYSGKIQAIWVPLDWCDANERWMWAGYFYQEASAMKYVFANQCITGSDTPY